MPIGNRIRDLREGFARSFWVANTLELFERLAFYSAKAVLAVYLAEKVGLGPQTGPSLVGLFSGLLYSLPIVAGTIVDRYGFRRSLASCFALFALGYFLIGFAGLETGQKIIGDAKVPYIVTVLVLTAVGGSLIKPCIVGTVANTTTEKSKALGYSIYYTLVNIGGMFGPLLALPIRERFGIEYVLISSAIISLGILIGTLLFFDEPTARPTENVRRLPQIFRDMLMVFGNLRFMLFLLFASGFYVMFWQTFYSLPFYAKDVLHFERFELLESVGAATIILLTVPASVIARRMKPIAAISVGMTVASLSWLLIPISPAVASVIAALALFSTGEAILAPRLYEYVATLAPREQIGTYMGFAFLPVAIGSFTAGPLAGWLVSRYVQGSSNPNVMWFVLSGIGIICTTGMLLYNQTLARRPVSEALPAR
ncbi:MAG TPA: MFS transporter [Bryobacteraceae bacterium]|nr:MFS transporter [Bryobacteraceae bacterium]